MGILFGKNTTTVKTADNHSIRHNIAPFDMNSLTSKEELESTKDELKTDIGEVLKRTIENEKNYEDLNDLFNLILERFTKFEIQSREFEEKVETEFTSLRLKLRASILIDIALLGISIGLIITICMVFNQTIK